MKTLTYAFLSVASLVICLIVPFLFLWAKIGESQFKLIFLAASMAWFVFATLWNGVKKKTSDQGKG
jgi:ABC-type nitrate/sulfonate/bicarbonate transport system permease component